MWTEPETIWTALFSVLLFVGGPFYIYKRRKKAKQLKAEGKLPYGKTYLGCTLPALIFVVLFVVGSCSIGMYMADQTSKIRKEYESK